MDKIKCVFYKNKSALYICMFSAFVFGLLAHGYMFFNNSVSHDSINEFLLIENVTIHKFELGRIFVPFYRRYIGGIITSPWLMGMISLSCTGLSSFLMTKLFNIKSELYMILTAGVLTVNPTVIQMVSTFLHDADCDMLALLFSVLSVYLLMRLKKGWLFGVVPLVITLGFYQSYISVAITLVIMVCILEILRGSEYKKVLPLLLKGAAMVLMAGVLYLIFVIIMPYITGIELSKGEYNSLTAVFNLPYRELINIAALTYLDVLKNIVAPFTYIGGTTNGFSLLLYAVIIFVPVIYAFRKISQQKIRGMELAFAIVLTLSLPIAMNISRILAGNMSHDLMHFAIWISYVFSLALLSCNSDENKGFLEVMKFAAAICLMLALAMNIRTANQAYTVRDFAYDSNLSLMTRVADRLEQTENYIPGETVLVFIGEPDYMIDIKEHEVIPFSMGMGAGKTTSVLGSAGTGYYYNYFRNILNTPVVTTDEDTAEKLKENEEVRNMPIFPHKDSIKFVDGFCVVKMGD